MNETTDASAMFAPIWRRKWLILTVGLIVAVGTYFYYKHQRPSYQATTQIYLAAGAEEQVSLTGVATSKRSSQLEPAAQATLINSAIIRSVVRKQLKSGQKTHASRTALTGKAKAKATEKSPFITITTEAHSAVGAAFLANLTAQVYVRRVNDKYHHAIEAAIALTKRQLRRLEADAEARSAEAAAAAKGSKGAAPAKSRSSSASSTLQLADLESKINQLEANLSVVYVRQVNPVKPKEVKQLSSSPKRNAVFGFIVGVLLACFAAYALARVDDRLRSLAEIETAFGTQLLTALPAVRRPILYEAGTPRPSKQLREPLERLHTSLQFGAAQHPGAQGPPRSILFVSANSGDGQSTILADLALVQRDAGASTTIVDANLRHPSQARLLKVDPKPGLPAVLEGQLAPGEALQGVGSRAPQAPVPDLGPAGGPVATVAHQPVTGSASVLVGGTVANASALLAAPAMDEIVRSLAAAGYVLVDAPPPLEVSDAMPLLQLVDGIIIIARVGQTRGSSARRLTQLLARTPSAPLLGVVANGASQKDIEKYGFSTPGGRSWRSRLA